MLWKDLITRKVETNLYLLHPAALLDEGRQVLGAKVKMVVLAGEDSVLSVFPIHGTLFFLYTN